MIRQLHISEPIYNTMCLLGKKYPATDSEFRALKLQGEFDSTKAGKRMKLPTPETWETLLSAKGNKASTWEELIEAKKLPFMAMLRNLRNLIFTGVHPRYHRWVINKLTNEQSVASSRQFPTQFFSAYEVIPKDMEDFKLKLQEQNKPKEKEGKKLRPKKSITPAYMPSATLFNEYREALDTAVKLATKNNVKPIKGSTVVFCNVSQEMKGDCSTAKGLGALKKLDEVGVLLGLMCKYICEDADFRIYSNSVPSCQDGHVSVSLLEGSILHNMKAVLDIATNTFASAPISRFPFEYLEGLIINKRKIDNLIVLSHTLSSPSSDATLSNLLNKYRREVNPDLLFVSVDLSGRGVSVMGQDDQRHPNDILITGFSDSILRFIAERGDNDQLQYVENIDLTYNLRSRDEIKHQSHLEELDKLNTSTTLRHNLEEELMSSHQWKTARVFISSTFLDMHGERDVLTRYVFPELKERCKKHRINLLEVDLRWGVTEEESQSNKSIEICLSEVKRCAPFFISLLGSRYGWCPSEYTVADENNFGWLKDYPKGKSITELEIQQIMQLQNARPLFYFRDPTFQSTIPPEYKTAFLSENTSSATNIDNLKSFIKSKGNKTYQYRCAWGGVFEGKPMVKGLDSFRKHVLEDLWNALVSEFNLTEEVVSPTTLEGEQVVEVNQLLLQRNYHLSFMYSNSVKFIARKELDDLKKHIESNESVVLWGKEGSGKSALVSRFAVEYSKKNPHVYLLTHFVGIGPGSSDIRSILTRLSLELISKFNIEETVPEDFNELCQAFTSIVEQASFKSRILIIIDALDQLTKANRAHSLDWLPRSLAAKVILTTLEGPCLDVLKKRKTFQLQVGSLPVKERKEIVKQTLSEYNKKLDDRPMNDQMRVLLKKTDADKPLYLIIACNELRLFGVYEQLTERIRSLPSTINKLFEEVLVRLEYDHGKDTLKNVVSLIAISRLGLQEEEIQSLLRRKEMQENLLPIAVWARIYSSIQSLLRPSHGGSIVLEFFHKEVIKAVHKRYLDFDQEHDIKIHKLLAEYYYAKADPSFDNSWSGNDIRSISELPYHLTKAKLWKALEKVLCNLTFIEKKCSLGMTADLIGDYLLATEDSATWKGNERGKESVVEFSKFVRGNAHILSEKSHLCYQLASNQPDTSIPARIARSLGSNVSKFWVKWLNKPQKNDPCKMTIKTSDQITSSTYSPDGSLILVATKDCILRAYNSNTGMEISSYVGHANLITSCTYSSDGSRMASSDTSGAIIVWDTYLHIESSKFTDHNRSCNSLNFSPDGKYLASASWDCTVKLYDAFEGKCIYTFRQNAKPVNHVSFSPDSTKLVTGCWDGSIKIINIEDKQVVATLIGHSKSVRDVCYSPSSKHIVSASMDNQVKIWDAIAAKEITSLTAHTKSVNCVGFSVNGEHLLSASEDGVIKVYDAILGKEVQSTQITNGWLTSVSASPKGDFIVGSHNECYLVLFNAVDFSEIAQLHGHNRAVSSVEFDRAHGKYIASTSEDHTIIIWDVATQSIKHHLRGHRDTVTQAKFSPDATQLVSCSDDFSLKIWDIESGRELYTLGGHTAVVKCCAWSPNGKFIASGARDCNINLYNANSGKLLSSFKGHLDWINCIAFSKDSKKLVTGSWDYNLKVWSVKDGKERSTLKGHSSAISTCAFSDDGKQVISSSLDGTLKVWDAYAGSEITTLLGHQQRVNGFDVTPQGDLVSVSDDGTLRLWDKLAGLELTTFAAHSDYISSAAFLPNGQILSSSNDKSAKLWDLNIADKDTMSHSKPILSLAFTNDGSTLASASLDNTIKLWHADTGKFIKQLKGNGSIIRTIAFNGSGSLLAAAGDDKSITIYDAKSGLVKKTITNAHGHSIRSLCFTPDNNSLLSASFDKTVKVWNLSSYSTTSTMNAHFDWVTSVACSPDSKYIASGSYDKTCIIWKQSRQHRKINVHDWVNNVAFSPDSKTVLVSYQDGKCIAYDPESGAELYKLEGHKGKVNVGVFSSNGRAILTASDDGVLKIWNAKSNKNVAEFITHTACLSLGVSSSNQIAVADDVGKIYLLSLAYAKV